MLVNKAYKFRIYPNKDQEILISKTIGCSRFVFNHFLAKQKETYDSDKKYIEYNECAKQLTQLKKDFSWLKEADATALQQSLKFLDNAYKRFFKKLNKFPRFKTKNNPVQSYKTVGKIKVQGNQLTLPKLGEIRFSKTREIEGRILNATVRRNPSGKYFVSILTEVEIQELPKTNSVVGIDVGLKDFAILSTGQSFRNLKWFRTLEKKLADA
ncbi:transposase, partial [Bacillus cereus]